MTIWIEKDQKWDRVSLWLANLNLSKLSAVGLIFLDKKAECAELARIATRK